MRKHGSSAVHPIVVSTTVSLFVGIGFFAQGCSSNKTDAQPAPASTTPASADSGVAPPCDPKLCAAGNECVNDGTDVKCRRPCAAQSECASNWACKQPQGAEKAFCVRNQIEYPPAAKGQWGAACNPGGGIDGSSDWFDKNPDCDSANSFWCHGIAPTDAHAFCTQFQCQTDAECKGGWYCAKVNVAPNVLTTVRTQKLTQTVCLPRTYGSPCESNVDCAPITPGDIPQVCVTDATGKAKYCTSACTNDANCALDAACVANEETGTDLCTPRAGVCKGDGSLCSPCQSDDDCPDGLCLTAPFSPEKFCSVTSKKPCVKSGTTIVADCPKAPTGAPYGVGCQTRVDNDYPQSQCFGIVDFGEGGNIGCWTVKRK